MHLGFEDWGHRCVQAEHHFFRTLGKHQLRCLRDVSLLLLVCWEEGI